MADNYVKVPLFEGRMIVRVRPNSIGRQLRYRNLCEQFAQDYAAEIEQESLYDTLIANYLYVMVGVEGIDFHWQGNEPSTMLYIEDWIKLALSDLHDGFTAHIELDSEIWGEILDSIKSPLTEIPVARKPAELLTEDEREAALDPKAKSEKPE